MKNIITKDFSIIVLSILILTNCTGKTDHEKKNNLIQYDISNGINEFKKIYLSSIASDIITIPLETTNECAIGNLYDLKISNNYILTRDNLDQIFLFDVKGKFLTKIGRKGKGPGEFVTATKMLLSENNKKIYIFDGIQLRVLSYNIDNGKFNNSVQLNFVPSNFNLYNDSTLIFVCTPPALMDSKLCMIHLMSIDFKELGSFKCYNRQYAKLCTVKEWGFTQIYNDNKKTFFWDSTLDTIYSFNENRHIEPEFIFHIKKKYKNTDKKLEVDLYRNLEKNKLSVSGFIECSDYIFINGIIKRHRRRILYNKRNKTSYNVIFNLEFHDNGFHNDLDGGVPFWPLGQISKDVLFSYMSPFILKKLLQQKYFKSIPINRPDRKKELDSLLNASRITDNPYIFIVKLKPNENI